MSYAVNIDSDQTDTIENMQLTDTPLSELFRHMLVNIERELSYSCPVKAYLFVVNHNNILSLYDTYNIDHHKTQDCAMINGNSCYCESICESTGPVVIDYADRNHEIQCNGIFPDPHIAIPIIYNNAQVGLVNISLPGEKDKSLYINNYFPPIFNLVSGFLGAAVHHDKSSRKVDRTDILLNAIDGMILDLDIEGSVINIESENNIMDVNIGLLIGHRLTNHFPDGDKQIIDGAFKRLSAGVVSRVKGEYKFRDRHGVLNPVEITIYPCTTNARCDGFTVVCRNIDQQRINSEALFNNLLASAPDAIVIADKDGRMVTVNDRCTMLFGYERGELIGQHIEMLLPEQLREAHKAMRERYSKDSHGRIMSENPNLLARHKSGFLKSVEISLSPFKQVSDNLTIAIVRDVSHRKLREDKFRRLAFVTEHSPDPIIELDDSGKVLYSNKIASVLSFDDTESGTYKHVIEQYKNTQSGEQTQDLIPRNLELGGRIYRQKVRHTEGFNSYFIYFRDVTDSQEFSNKLCIKEKTDSLTGLSNRIAFIASLKDAINRANIYDVSHTIIYIDLEVFMNLNSTILEDSKNNEAFLKMVARLLKDNIRQSDTLARLQDGKFAVLLEYCPVSKGFQVAEKIKATLNAATPVWPDGQDENSTLLANIGVVEIAKSFDSYHEILASAETACHSAKENGDNSIFLYNKKSQMLRIKGNVAS
ncbi:MAG: PAS domain S-box protein [Gammaproteobacteria bacterium]|nr:PAS domain S-box protein [Gammaproteobacteria bacterium]